MAQVARISALLVLLYSSMCSVATVEEQSKLEQAPAMRSASLMQRSQVREPMYEAPPMRSASLMQKSQVTESMFEAFEDPFASLEDEFDGASMQGTPSKQPFDESGPSIDDVFYADSITTSGKLKPSRLPNPLMCTLAACLALVIAALSGALLRLDRNTAADARQALHGLKQLLEYSDLNSCKDANQKSPEPISTCPSKPNVEEEPACDSSSGSETGDEDDVLACSPALHSALCSASKRRSATGEAEGADERITNWRLINERLATAIEDSAGCTQLHMAVAENLPCMTKRLLEQRSNVNATDAWDETPLHFAARLNGSAEVCAHLLNHGAHINAVNADGATPVLLAARAGHSAACELLLANGGGLGGAVDDADLPPLLTALLAQRMIS